MTHSVRLEAPAKVNLRLEILAREASGYHTLETVFCALALCDTVRVTRATAGVALQQQGSVDTGPPERNLAVRAASAFYAALGEPAAIAIELEKRIPAAAGLGGGSSDAGAVLRALNALHGEPLAQGALLQLAIGLGADVPFFLCGSALALAWGRGERLLPLPALPPRPVLVAHPGQALATADAFADLARQRPSDAVPRAALADANALSTWEGAAAAARNDFEPIASARIPLIGQALTALRAQGADPALLAGSGSAVFGIFADESQRDVADVALQRLGLATWRTETLAAMPAPVVDG